MKLALSSFAWPPAESAGVAAALATIPQVSGVELVLPMAFKDPATATMAEVEAVRRIYADQGLTIVSVQSLAYGKPELQLLGDATVRAAFRDHLLHMAQIAAGLGARTMVFGSPANRRRGAMSMEDAMSIAVEFFKQLGEELESSGVVVTVEPNPPIYADCDMIVRVEEALELVRRVDHPLVKLQLDTGAIAHAKEAGHASTGDVLIEAVDRAAHLHLSVPGLGPLHREDAAQTRIAKEMLEAGVSQQARSPWASIEMKQTGVDADPLPAIRAAVEAACLWYPIAPRT